MTDSTASRDSKLEEIFNESAQINDLGRAFFKHLLEQHPDSFGSLFAGENNGLERESMIYGAVKNMLETGMLFYDFGSELNGRAMSVDYSRPLQYLSNEGYVIVDADCRKLVLTDKMMRKLVRYCPSLAEHSPSDATGYQTIFIQGAPNGSGAPTPLGE